MNRIEDTKRAKERIINIEESTSESFWLLPLFIEISRAEIRVNPKFTTIPQ